MTTAIIPQKGRTLNYLLGGSVVIRFNTELEVTDRIMTVLTVFKPSTFILCMIDLTSFGKQQEASTLTLSLSRRPVSTAFKCSCISSFEGPRVRRRPTSETRSSNPNHLHNNLNVFLSITYVPTMK